jgi:hypothetical protein
LRDEARRQGVGPEEILVHATMYYLSDLHTGRAARRILRRSKEAPPRRPDRGTRGRF